MYVQATSPELKTQEKEPQKLLELEGEKKRKKNYSLQWKASLSVEFIQEKVERWLDHNLQGAAPSLQPVPLTSREKHPF